MQTPLLHSRLRATRFFSLAGLPRVRGLFGLLLGLISSPMRWFPIFLLWSGLASAQSIDPTFNPTDVGFGFGDGDNGTVRSVAVQADGKVTVPGAGGNSYEQVMVIARINSYEIR